MADNVNSEPKIDINKAFEAIAKIMSNRYKVDIKVTSIRKRDVAKEKAG